LVKLLKKRSVDGRRGCKPFSRAVITGDRISEKLRASSCILEALYTKLAHINKKTRMKLSQAVATRN
jgi:hypothetical protein